METMLRSYPGMSASIADWKGQDIVNFQEELLRKVNAHISEKWFYTHMKSDQDKLPRIDMLNVSASPDVEPMSMPTAYIDLHLANWVSSSGQNLDKGFHASAQWPHW